MIRKIFTLAGAAVLALTMSGTALASPAPTPGKAPTISPVPTAQGPLVLSNRTNVATCYFMQVAGSTLEWNDPGEHSAIRITINNNCFDPELVAGGTADVLHIGSGGTDCAKEVYPTASENNYIYDEPCSNTDPLEQFVFYYGNYGYVICLKQYEGGDGGNCLAHSLAVNAIQANEVVGAKQGPYNGWALVCARGCSAPSLSAARWRR
jgi:hypothetical protein